MPDEWQLASQRRTIRPSDYDGQPVRVVYDPPAPAEPAPPADEQELIEVCASGLSHEQVRRFGLDEKPIRLQVSAETARRMRGEES